MSDMNFVSGLKISEALGNAENEDLGALCVHAIGLGKAGCDTVIELMTRAQVEDQLVYEEDARLAVLCIDIGDRELRCVRRAANGLKQRLMRRGVSEDKILVKTWNIKPPVTQDEEDEFYGSMMNVREYFKVEYPRQYWNPNYEPWVNPDDDTMPKENEHTYRSLAKALYYDNYYRKGLKEVVSEFCNYVNDTLFPGIVYMFYGMAGGLGSGIAYDVARHVSTIWFGRRQIFCGFGYLPSHRDEDAYQHTGNVMSAMMECECYINPEANDGTVSVWGETYRNPFTGGFYLVPRESMAVRTRAIDERYEDKLKDNVIKHRLEYAEQIVNRTIDLSLCDFLVDDNTRHFRKAAACTGQITTPWNQTNNGERSWNMIFINEFIHGACEVAPGTNVQSIRDEAKRFISYMPNYDDLAQNFKTDFIHVDCYGAKANVDDEVKNTLENYFKSKLLEGGKLVTDYHTGYDEMNSWITAVIPGISLSDVVEFVKSRDIYDSIEDWNDRLHTVSSLIEVGPMIEEPSIRQKGLAGECIWGCACFIVYPYLRLRGEGEYPPYRPEMYAQANEAFEDTINPMIEEKVL